MGPAGARLRRIMTMGIPIKGTEDDDDLTLYDPSILAEDNEIWGYQGQDWINGGGGNDVIFCDWGDDEAGGGDGVDVIYGENGNDILLGGAGDDWLVGGNGHDEL